MEGLKWSQLNGNHIGNFFMFDKIPHVVLFLHPLIVFYPVSLLLMHAFVIVIVHRAADVSL